MRCTQSSCFRAPRPAGSGTPRHRHNAPDRFIQPDGIDGDTEESDFSHFSGRPELAAPRVRQNVSTSERIRPENCVKSQVDRIRAMLLSRQAHLTRRVSYIVQKLYTPKAPGF
jgi:hypothetical protein